MSDSPRHSLDDLLAIMARLRDPERGCPWDVKQDFASIAAYTIEEAYEVADAIDRRDWHDLRDELGDLLLQVAFHAQMAAEQGLFDFADVAHAISAKMLRRHPHVFGDTRYADLDEQMQAWEAIKAAERADKGAPVDTSTLAGISSGLPEWKRAQKLQQRAAAVGFAWPGPAPVLAKLAEEVDEVRAEFANGADPARLQDEIGDVLFVLVNLARHAGVDFSQALRHANAKFERRFRQMEQLAAADGTAFAERTLDEQEQLWRRAKQQERQP
ncbi:nucleoside triphosphate hydrolase [Rhodanobacter thiooxydans]|uniref:Nucleoside triphosphate hydrolase n=1 Tax=Rhodanobacter thiooxydans TaxID=416169 RepID=A0A154QM93_9GAMM|nr:nucleoside triphosphate pyrophosphohydrolase [Rhodanobacter thiooxydans]EIL99715.1 nucleoside triphosphate pyrophosphohydrolase [Rhodanobacter thiooxydans LCS2]KZC25310.1 nucleoside triphosphate hydrolase [Rhodanobacter thiooxydans]MCW0202373.1 nucleoside triphosphate pyrophosphohydrolase [Rhodanobacter thiooxydans]